MRLGTADADDLPPYCNSPTEAGTLGNSFCGAQSFFFFFGGLSAANWFLVVGTNLFLMLVFDYR